MRSTGPIPSFLAAALAALAMAVIPDDVAAQSSGVIQGKIVEVTSKQPLPGVQVLITGTQRGTLTDANGVYRIPEVPLGDREVRVMYIGFGSQTKTVRVAAEAPVVADFELKQQVIDLEEIVVTGVAGQSTKGKIAFSLERLTEATMPVPAQNAAQMLAGKVPGATVVTSTGRPGAAPSILLRGPTSIRASGRSQEPLYIVDGVILSSSVADIDAQDIESIEIVKGAAGASMYGSRAANGVIQITTKRGKNIADDQVRYTLRTEVGTNDMPGRFNLTQKHQFLMRDGQFVSQNGTACDWIKCPNLRLAGQMALAGQAATEYNTIMRESWPGVTYDHVERFFKGGDYMTNSLSIAGRSGGTNYLVSYNRQQNEGVLPYHDGDLGHTFRINLDQSVRSDMTISASASYTRRKSSSDDGAMFQLTRMPAGVDLTASDPRQDSICACNSGIIIIKPDPFNDNINPLYNMSTTNNVSERSRYLGSITARYSPTDWINIDGNFSFDRADVNGQGFRPKGFRNIQGVAQGGNLSRSHNKTEGMNASITGAVRRSFGELNTSTQVRYLIEKQDQLNFNAAGSDFTAEGVWTFDNMPSTTQSAGSSITPIRRDGFFVISDVDFRDRYIVSGLIRQDGSSLFGPEARRKWYGRGSVAYRISEEPWFNIPNLDDLKLRYSIGSAGNEPNFTAQYETYSVSGGSITPVTLGNKDLKPEYSVEQEMGIEALFMGRFAFDLTYARTETRDQLLQVPALAFTGFTSQWRNAGSLESNTWEASLNAQLIQKQNLGWNARLLFDRTRHEITELNVPPYQDGVGGQGLGNVFYIRKGESLGTFYGFQFAENCGHLPTGVDCADFQVNDDGYLVYVGAAGSYKNGWQTYQDASGNEQRWWGTVAPVTIRGAQIRWGEPFQGEGDDPITGERTTFLRIGKTTPDFKLGFANTINYKGFTIYGLLESVQGFQVYNQPLQWAVFQSYAGIMDQSEVAETEQKPVSYFARLYGASGLQPSSAFVDEASYIKFHELSVRYRASAAMLDRLPVVSGFEGLTISVTGRNLYTWSDYDGYDPDVGSNGGGVGSAALARVDGFGYPPFRTFTLGFELNF